MHGLIKVLGPMRPLVVPDQNALKCSNPLQVPIWEISLPNLGKVEVITELLNGSKMNCTVMLERRLISTTFSGVVEKSRTTN